MKEMMRGHKRHQDDTLEVFLRVDEVEIIISGPLGGTKGWFQCDKTEFKSLIECFLEKMNY